MKKIIILKICCFLAMSSFAQKQNYAVTDIPKSLLKSDAVVRDYSMNYDIKSPSKATLKEHRVITLMDDDSNLNLLAIGYDKFRKIESISGRLYDASGKFIRKISKKEITDRSMVSDFSIYEDDRVKYVEINHSQYPYTVEYEYEVSFRGIRSYPDWSPQFNDYGVAVEASSYRIAVPEDMDIRYQSSNFEPDFEESNEGGAKVYQWQITDLKPLRQELYAPARADIFPVVRVSPTVFSIDGQKGDMSTWQSFGKFMYDLNEGRGIPTEKTYRVVQSLTKDLNTNKEKIAALYKYLRETNRYVSVQLGIGGWQSFDTEYVEKNKYGDCKALSYYMKAMLEAAGIKAHTALIESGKYPEKIDNDYVHSAFNHMILYVPEEDVWLECTASYQPSGYLGTGTENRKALLVTPEGGQLVETPKTSPENNVGNALIKVKLDEAGSAKISVRSTKTGSQQSWHRSAKNTFSEKELKDELQESLEALPSFSIDKQEIILDENAPSCEYNYDLSVRKLATVQGKRLFIRPNVIHQYRSVPDREEERKQRIVNHRGRSSKDRIEIELPEGYVAESLPEKVELQTDFGTYQSTCELSGNQLIYQRHLTINNYDLPPEKYQDMFDFYNQIKKSDMMKAVFVKK